MKVRTVGTDVELELATDEELVEDAQGMMARWTDYRIECNDVWHTAMVAELESRGLTAAAAELRRHRAEQEA